MIKKVIFVIFAMLILAIPTYAEKQEKGIEIYLFHSEHCKACLHFRNEIQPGIMEKYGDLIYFTEFDVDKEDDFAQLASLASLYSRDTAYPAVYLDNKLMIGNKEITENLTNIIDELLKKNNKPVPLDPKQRASLTRLFNSFGAFTIAGAGLIDGINPCAFTVIVFFVSFLAVYGYRRRELLIIGTSYILAVFLVYLGIGIGLFKFLYALKSFYFAMKIFYLAIAALCFVLAVLCMLDYMRYNRTGSTEESFLQLPGFLKKKIRGVIGDEFRGKSNKSFISLCIGAFTVGVIVSLLEAVCTGQVYLPVISFVLRRPGLQLKAAFYLILYNVMFIFPLVIVFALSLWGMSSQQFSEYYKERYGFVRICMFLLFLCLGLFMLSS